MSSPLRQSVEVGAEADGAIAPTVFTFAPAVGEAGWHRSKALRVPSNLTLLPLPPYSPELNTAETLWGFMRSHYLSNRQYCDYDHLFTTACDACREVDEQRIRPLCRTSWIERAV